MNRVVIAGKAHPVLERTLVASGYDVLYKPDISDQELNEHIPFATGLVLVSRLGASASLIDKAPRLKWIGRLGSGMEHIDVEYANSKGIRCVSSPEGNRIAVAEHVMALLLNLLNHITVADREVKQGLWLREENRGVELKGKTVGIIGYGNTGSALAGLLSSFGVDLIVYDKYKKGLSSETVREVSMESILMESDIISMHIPLTDETWHMADSRFFSMLRKRPIFLNASRGGVADTRAIVDALETGKIRGACLDVLENEYPSSYSAEESQIFQRLAAHPRVLLTPHIAGYTEEAFYKIALVLLEKLGLAVT